MVKFLTALIAIILGSSAVANDQCELEGAGKIKVSCDGLTQNLKVEANGGDSSSVDSVSVTVGSATFRSNPEIDLPASIFERVDESVFTLKFSNPEGYLSIMGFPRSFTVKSEKVYRPSATIYTGEFLALISAGSDAASIEVQSAVAACTFEILDCAREKIDLPNNQE